MNDGITRRGFLGTAVAAATGVGSLSALPARVTKGGGAAGKPALLGGTPVRAEPFPAWPVVEQNDENGWTNVLHEGHWCRLDGNHVKTFEELWARMTGAKHCLATASGTTALCTSLNALDIGPGDEVIVPPYTFVATINVVLLQHALPIFVDTDRETFQIDANKIEAAITPRTRCILPVHLGGSAADLDKVLEVGRRHNIPVLEDACQAHLAEWRGRKVATWGALGCFSFQASKNLNSGEGGAILTNDDRYYETCQSFYNNGRGKAPGAFSYVRNGCNHRMTEFQGALLVTQAQRVEEQSRRRGENAAYLTKLLGEIPGIAPARMYEGCTRNAYHLYMFRYDPAHFANLPRSRFIEALHAEGIPCSPGYVPLNKEPFMKFTLSSRAFRKVFPATVLSEYEERNRCPENDKLCEEAVWMFQTMFLGARTDMDQIAEAVRKVQAHAPELAKA
jgi:dTDP-4-amino-4,6-dideoxygalactose transaminase